MVPTTFHIVDDIPLLPNGKVDKNALKDLAEEQTDAETNFEEPNSEVELQLVSIWEEVLNFSPISINDNFFEIGGDSILSVQVISKARKTGNYDIGVDIECFKDDFDVLDIAENFFSRREIDKLKMQPLKEQRQAFYRCWTRKEAFIKAEGSGLSFPLDKFTVSMHSDNEANLEHTDWSPDEKDRWNMFSFKPAQNYIAALAVKGSTTSLNTFEWK